MFYIKDGILFFKSVVFFFFEHIRCDLLNSSNFILSVQKSVSQKDCVLSTCLLGTSNMALLCLLTVGSSTMEATLSQMKMYSVTCYSLILEIRQEFFDLFSCSIIETILFNLGLIFLLELCPGRKKQSLCTMEQRIVDDIYLY